jgi:hypothetical protein
MRYKLIEIEEKILQNRQYLINRYPQTENFLYQLSNILDFGLENKYLEKWFKMNKITIDILTQLIEKQNIQH